MRQKNTTAKDIKKNPLLGEVSRLHRDGEGYTFTDTRKPHHNRPPAFSLAAKGAKKKLGKKKRRLGNFAVATARRRAPPSPARAFEKLDQNFKARQNRRLNADLFEKD